ncbi:hypothetical protein [Xenorhabdus bovienii]|uniref:hypothetical protein n=1 Tax=Xenorhabdus bovienii TaxID=40576 RepID=UPI0023B2FB70|nr:hypothetical protein [Xenorhabdus bovienii]MDE9455859.1 hypothetical protein [Xenorhabdus bovienii]
MFTCNYCPFSTNTLHGLSVHMGKKHPNELLPQQQRQQQQQQQQRRREQAKLHRQQIRQQIQKQKRERIQQLQLQRMEIPSQSGPSNMQQPQSSIAMGYSAQQPPSSQQMQHYPPPPHNYNIPPVQVQIGGPMRVQTPPRHAGQSPCNAPQLTPQLPVYPQPQTSMPPRRATSPIRPVYDNPSSEDFDDMLETLRSHARTPSPRR